VLEYDSIFCANIGCMLHVRPEDVNVRGNGNWAENANGVILGRQGVGTVMLCDQCAVRAAHAASWRRVDEIAWIVHLLLVIGLHLTDDVGLSCQQRKMFGRDCAVLSAIA
jgi:hypothetical protein